MNKSINKWRNELIKKEKKNRTQPPLLWRILGLHQTIKPLKNLGLKCSKPLKNLGLNWLLGVWEYLRIFRLNYMNFIKHQTPEEFETELQKTPEEIWDWIASNPWRIWDWIASNPWRIRYFNPWRIGGPQPGVYGH